MTAKPDLPDAKLRALNRKLAFLKANDERFRALIKAGRVAMPFYSWRGQEAVAAGFSEALRPDDYLCTIYRGIHDSLARGVPLDLLWAELFGKAAGTCKGKGGPMHITHPASGVMVTTGIVGSSMPIANGLALAAQIEGNSRVAVATFGDGASNIGAFHESLNLASVWKLPVIFLCSNNRYSEHTKFANVTPVAQVADRAASYGMPGVTIDGNDPVVVHDTVAAAAARARAGEGPTLIEAMTFRFHGHVLGDTDSYMDAGEKEAAMAADPVPLFRARLIEWGIADEATLAAEEAEIEAEIDAAEAFAFAAAPPDPAEVMDDIYARAA